MPVNDINYLTEIEHDEINDNFADSIIAFNATERLLKNVVERLNVIINDNSETVSGKTLGEMVEEIRADVDNMNSKINTMQGHIATMLDNTANMVYYLQSISNNTSITASNTSRIP